MLMNQLLSYSRIKNPVYQAGLVATAILLCDLLLLFANSAGASIEQRMPWTISLTFVLFFIILNVLSSLLNKDLEKYWTRSMLSFVALALVSGGLAYLFSSQTMREAGSYRWIFIVLTIGYLVFISIIGMARKIVEYAQREEWNHPRLRKKKKRK
ncbi:MAG: hypothetical protein Kow0027_24230 [Saprospiraceae bacterium]